MKLPVSLVRSLIVAASLALSAGAAMAYTHDKSGWIDDQHHHHPFTHYHGHRGYWNQNAHGTWIFINV